ncbi:hypothetical protein AQV86_02015 [Nanohaloarchaea archaeon SG9]|nr:hypothetical protein AQV86_02015 [Nanohaloarchaea archaeon SG9]
MVYTTFAIVATNLLLLLFLTTSGSNDYTSSVQIREGEASHYQQSVEDFTGKTHEIALKTASSAVINHTLRQGEGIQDGEETLEALLINGTSDEIDRLFRYASLNKWREDVSESAEDRGYTLSIKFNKRSLDDSFLSMTGNLTSRIELEAPQTSSRFNKTVRYENQVSLVGLEDTMLFSRSDETYRNKYRRCSFRKPAEKITDGTVSNQGATFGKATRNKDSGNKEEKILVTDGEPNSSRANAYAGTVASSNEDPEYKNTKYIFGAETADIEEGEDLILYRDQVWSSRIRQIINTGCYLKSNVTGETGPGLMERMENKLQAQENETEGLLTIIDKKRLPEELQYPGRSSIGYKYFRSDEGKKIAGLTGNKSFDKNRDGYREDFRLDEQHIEKWNLNTPDGGLTY